MPDNLSLEQRRRAMSHVKSRDTKPEQLVRSALHRRGLRFRKHSANLPGCPDIVFSRACVAVFIDGDFWHGYQFHRWKNKLTPFWLAKITRTRERDARTTRPPRAAGWRVVRVWENSIEHNIETVIDRIESQVRNVPARPSLPS